MSRPGLQISGFRANAPQGLLAPSAVRRPPRATTRASGGLEVRAGARAVYMFERSRRGNIGENDAVPNRPGAPASPRRGGPPKEIADGPCAVWLDDIEPFARPDDGLNQETPERFGAWKCRRLR
jgi:hypothetical protein